MNHRWLVLRLEAPLVSFGGVAIDQVRPSRDFPAASMLTGMIGNALGWRWSDSAAHQSIQDRLIFAVRIDREGTNLTDTQNASLAKDDRGWTTRGVPEGRDGASYGAPHRRQRDYRADSSVKIALRLELTAEPPALDSLADAFDRPARPLFLGRKACLPSRPLLSNESDRWVLGDTAHQALCALPGDGERHRALWPVGEGPETGDDVDRIVDMPDLRNWRTGLHSGSRRVVEGWVAPVTAT